MILNPFTEISEAMWLIAIMFRSFVEDYWNVFNDHIHKANVYAPRHVGVADHISPV